MTFKELREKRGFEKGTELARTAGLEQTTISQLDLGKIRNPRYLTVKAIAEALGTTTDIVYRAIERTPEAA